MKDESQQQVPTMTHPLGKHWEQPHRSKVLVDEKSAVMDKYAFDELKNYSATNPSGVYEGKMWKCLSGGHWFLCWYGPSDQPERCSINTRSIIIL